MGILVTGGAGFIGTNFVLRWLDATDEEIVNVDRLTYAGNAALHRSLAAGSGGRSVLVEGDVADAGLVAGVLRRHAPRAVVHFAAETHVDRSIERPGDFVRTNVLGTAALLEACLAHWAGGRRDFRFVHVSTDEVYGSLGPDDAPFTESSPYRPGNPYSASKAAADHLVRAWAGTYSFPAVVVNCSNNYGPYQHPEKLVPLMIKNALSGRALPLYGDGRNVRDWVYVEDCCEALRRVLEDGRTGADYNVGGGVRKTNEEVVEALCGVLDERRPRACGGSHRDLVAFVEDRPGHDRRYAVDFGRMEGELGWRPRETFEGGVRRTVAWYLDNRRWLDGAAGRRGAAARGPGGPPAPAPRA